jgi:hypothetical protein
MLLWESGQLPFWVKNDVPPARKCFAQSNPRRNLSRQVPIQLKDLMSAFFILGIGLGLATLAFLSLKSKQEFVASPNKILSPPTPLLTPLYSLSTFCGRFP